jgi:hypothetical protein
MRKEILIQARAKRKETIDAMPHTMVAIIADSLSHVNGVFCVVLGATIQCLHFLVLSEIETADHAALVSKIGLLSENSSRVALTSLAL